MDAAGEALNTAITGLTAEVATDNEAVVNAGNAVAAAGTKFAELKAAVEKAVAGGALSDEEAAALTTASDATGASLTTATTALTEHVTTLSADTASA